ncbi:hypothetical protein PIB30_048719 [Stylosanthes scabra]|uniref:PB1-like domain-containing protein n=1 Tax=Stylosanthes scabra TaxID=79078 RepID=A0ABU6VGT7_9FABA|nr:hypothetical protein [Stylosanthes scabra]
MGDTFVVPIFHHGGNFIQNLLGELEYANGMVERFEDMDLDMNALEFETGLNRLERDDGIRELIDHLIMNLEFEFHLYWEHGLIQVIWHGVAQSINLESDSDSHSEIGANGDNVAGASPSDGYESAENGAYKPPPLGYDENDNDINSEIWASMREKGRSKKKTVVESKKGVSPRENVHQRKGRYVKKEKNVDMGMEKNGENRVSGVGGAGLSGVHQGDVASVQVDSVLAQMMALHTPISSKEEYKKHVLPEFDYEYGFGERHFELGIKFATIEKFMDVGKDLFIFECRILSGSKVI